MVFFCIEKCFPLNGVTLKSIYIMRRLLKGFIVVFCSIWFIYSFQNPSSSANSNEITEENFSLENSIQEKNSFKKNQEWLEALRVLNNILKNDYFDNEITQDKFHEEGVQIIEQLDEKHIEVAQFYQIHGDFLVAYDKIDSAIFFLEKAQNQILTNESSNYKSTIEANILISLALANYYENDFDEMLQHLKEAEKINESTKLDEQPKIDMNQLLGVYFYDYEKDYEKGVEYTLRALQISEQRENDLYEIASLHNNLGVLYGQLQEFTKSAFHFQKTLALYDVLDEDNAEKIDVLHNYNRPLIELGQLEKAKQLLFKAKLYNKLPSNLSDKYNILLNKEFAIIYTRQNKLDSASFYINEALIYANQSKDKTPLLYTLKEEGNLLFKQKKYVAAIQSLEKALVLSRGVTENLVKEIEIHNLLGQIYIEQKQFKKAATAFDTALELNQRKSKEVITSNSTKIYNSTTWLESLSYKANALHEMNTSKSTQKAFELYQEAITYAEKMRQNFTFEATKSILNTKTSELYTNTIQIAHQLYEETQDQKYIETAFSIAEKQKGIVLLESFIDKKGKASYGVPNDLIERESNFKNKIAYYRQQIIEFEDDADKLATFEGYFNDYSLKLAQVKDTLKNFYSDYFEVEYQAAIASVEEVKQEILRPEQAFIEYISTKDSVFYVFVIEKEKQHFLKIPYQKIEQDALQLFQERLSQPKLSRGRAKQSFREFASSASDTYDYLFEPILKKLSPDVNSFIIVRAGQISTIPFEALLSQKVTKSAVDFVNLSYLIHDYQFHYGYSASLLLKNKEQQSKLKSNNECLAFAPVYEPIEDVTRGSAVADRGNITPLIGTANEIKAISKYFGGNFDATSAASEERFKEKVKDYGILHLAMHGQSDVNEPAYAHLVFANSSFNSEEDGFLYQYEIANLDTKAQLAVLSACETGVGKDVEGEGVMSLGRAFMYAGVPSVVMSLWKMNDISTSELMPFFYKNLANNSPKDKALHEAKLTYLNQATPERAHPFYWAGLIAIGDTTPIQNNDSGNWNWWLAGFVVLVGAGGYLFWKR
jgi:CHAT domain-containing protein